MTGQDSKTGFGPQMHPNGPPGMQGPGGPMMQGSSTIYLHKNIVQERRLMNKRIFVLAHCSLLI